MSKNHGWVETLDFYRFPNPLSPPYFLGAIVDSTQHYRLSNNIKSINLEDTNPISRYVPGNEWISKRLWAYGTPNNPNPNNATLYKDDSIISVQQVSNTIIAYIKTHAIYIPGYNFYSGYDSTYFHYDTISLLPTIKKLNDSILPEYNWNLQHLSSLFPSNYSEFYYLRRYTVDTVCNGLFNVYSHTINIGMGIIKDTNGCVKIPVTGLYYPAIVEWGYIEGFGYNYNYYDWCSGDPICIHDETTYPYIKLGSCTIGSKNVLSTENPINISNDISIYPNPANTFVSIRLPINSQKTSVDFYDIVGKKVLTYTTDGKQFTVDVTQLTPGMYTVRVMTSYSIKSQKLLIIK